MRVAVITVGDELLSGDTTNTNAAWLGKRLTERGVHVERMIVVPDHVGDIAQEVNEARAEYDAVIVTGGLGPTHDDVTMEGVAAAFGVPVVEHPDAQRWFDEHEEYARDDLVAGTTHLPKGATMLPNDVGVAPGAVVGSVYVLPGVPAEMQAMFEAVAPALSGTVRSVTNVFVDEPESALIDRLADLRERFDVKIGSYPGRIVKIKIEGADQREVEAAAAWLTDRVAVVDAPDGYR
jgi:molybdenum cofactor synthesis domain-containing protein